MDGKEAAWAFGDPGAKGHVEVAQSPSPTVEGVFFLTVFIQEPVVFILLQGVTNEMKEKR